MSRRDLKTAALASILLSFVAVPSLGQPLANMRISEGTHSEEPHLVVDGQGRLFAVWKEPVEPHCLDPLVFARSFDGGHTWSKERMPLQYPSGGEFGDGHSDPWLTVDEQGRIYCARDEGYFGSADCGEGSLLITVVRSDDGGATWGPIVDVTQGVLPDKPTIQADGNGRVYLSYMDYGHDPTTIHVRSSDDGGATWSPSKTLGQGSSSAIAARPDGRVYVAWVTAGGQTPQFAASFDRGETWTSPVNVYPPHEPVVPLEWSYLVPTRQPIPAIATDSRGRIFVAWSDRVNDNDILIVRSEDQGATWSAPVRINDETAGDQWTAELAIDTRDALHAAWYDSRSGHMNLYYARSTDAGQTWSPNVAVMPQHFETARLGEYFGLAADADGAAYMVWTGAEGVPNVPVTRRSPRYIYFARTEPAPRPGPCAVGPEVLCLNGGRFEATVEWNVPSQGRSGKGAAVPLTGDTGYFWFFDSNNVELVVKALDARSINDHFWIFYGALSAVEYVMTVRNTETGVVKRYFNPSGTLASVADTAAFGEGSAVNVASREADAGFTADLYARYAARALEAPVSSGPAAACSSGSTTLCLNQGRFRVTVDWSVPSQNRSGSGQAVALTGDTGYLWFFSDANVELIVKVLDGRSVNGHFWVFYGALSNVQYTIRVTDTETGAIKTYENPSGTLASHADTSAF